MAKRKTTPKKKQSAVVNDKGEPLLRLNAMSAQHADYAEHVKSHKEYYLKCLEKTLGVQTPACKMANIHPDTIIRWKKEDPEFGRKCNAVNEVKKDFIESALMRQIKNDVPSTTIFAAKTLLKDRGYIEDPTVQIHNAPTINLIASPQSHDNPEPIQVGTLGKLSSSEALKLSDRVNGSNGNGNGKH